MNKQSIRHVVLPIILSIAVFAQSFTIANADDISVTTTSDSVLIDGLTSLREAFIQASSNGVPDTIILSSGMNYVLDFCAAGPLTHSENFPLTLTGNSASIQNTCIDGMGTIAITGNASFLIDNVEMSGVIDDSADFVNGAAIRSENASLISILNSEIHGFDADGGSIIYSSFTDITITDSQIHDNEGTAVVSDFSSVMISGSTIVRNTIHGVSLVDGNPLIIDNSFIQDNGGRGARTTGQGHSVMTVTNTSITGNGDVGMSCSACSLVEVAGSDISNNGQDPTASSGGGGISVSWDIDDPTDSPELIIADSTIDNNTSTNQGGGIRVTILESSDETATPALLSIDNSSISMNSTKGFTDIEGGGIYVETGNVLIENNSVLDGNWAGPPGGFTSANGGGIYQRELATFTQPTGLTINNSAVNNNMANSQGGGVWVVIDGPVSINDSILSDNSTNLSGGGGLYTSGAEVTINRSTFAFNSGSTGGGISLSEFSGFPEGDLTINESTFNNNTASFAASGGGGIFVNVGDGGVTAKVNNSTISSNTSANFGGGIMVMQTSELILDHSTVTNNTGVNGANIFVAAGDFEVQNSIINSPVGGENCNFFSASTISNGYTYASDSSCNLGGDDVISAIALGPLSDNGGPTFTHALLPPSDAIDAIPDSVNGCGTATTSDQRGLARPQDGDDDTVTACDSGAYERSLSSGVMGDFVWADANGNGMQDNGEPGIEGVTVKLRVECDTNEVLTIMTDSDGKYRFEELTVGNYQLQFIKPDGFIFSPLVAAGDYTKDSNANTQTGLDICRSIDVDQLRLALDAGLIPISSVSVVDMDVTEDAGSILVKVVLDSPSMETLSVRYATKPGSALPGQDYRGRSGKLTFNPGETMKTFLIPVLDNNQREPTESFIVRLSSPVNVIIGDNEATITINDDDTAGPVILSIDDIEVQEDAGTAMVIVRLNQMSAQTVTVKFATKPGTALPGQDFRGKSGKLTFNPGETEKIISVKIIDSVAVESDEDFTLKIFKPTKAVIGDGIATVTIVEP